MKILSQHIPGDAEGNHKSTASKNCYSNLRVTKYKLGEAPNMTISLSLGY